VDEPRPVKTVGKGRALAKTNRKGGSTMAKPNDVVQQAVKDIQGLLKQTKDSDEEDLATRAVAFDQIADRADLAAVTLRKADEALAGDSQGGGQQDGRSDEEDEQQGE
jgi:hypothetical protein